MFGRLVTVIAALVAAAVLAAALPAARGDLDPTFGSGGKVTTDFGGNEIGWSVAVQPDGKAVVAGDRFDPGPSDDFVLARYTANGALDSSFDADGKVTTDFNNHFSGAFAVALQADRKIVAVGYGFASTGPQDFALARYNPDGSLDQSFGAGGKVLTTFQPNSIDGAGAVALQSDGKIIAGGRTRSTPTTDFALARFMPNGALDASFDGDGLVVTPVSSESDQVFDLAVQSDGRIVAAGTTFHAGGGSDTVLTRYNADGSLDSSFDGDGTAVLTASGFVGDLDVQRDGKLVVADLVGLARFNSDGSVDRGFGAGGRARMAGLDANARSVEIQPDGKLLAIGTVFTGPRTGDFIVARLMPNGSPDRSYGRAGSVVTGFAEGSEDQAIDGDLRPDGKLVVSGMTRATPETGPADFAVARFNAILYCIVPKVRGRTLGAARVALTKSRCKLGTLKRKYSAEVKKGRVISQRPAPRARLAELAKVNLVVSRGRRR